MSLIRTAAASIVLATVALAAGCAEPSETETTTGEAAVTGSLQVGHYVLDGAGKHGALKELLLHPGQKYSSRVYQRGTGPLEPVEFRDRAYEITTDERGNLLVLRSQQGNVLDTYVFTVGRSSIKMHAVEADVDFTMKYAGPEQEFDTLPVRGTNPGTPPAVDGGRRLTCHSSGGGDLRANFSISAESIGTVWITGKEVLAMTGVDKVKLASTEWRESDRTWIRVDGEGRESANKYYEINIPRSLVTDGGHNVAISFSWHGQAYEDAETFGEPVVCDAE